MVTVLSTDVRYLPVEPRSDDPIERGLAGGFGQAGQRILIKVDGSTLVRQAEVVPDRCAYPLGM
jgi:hypothetical protein